MPSVAGPAEEPGVVQRVFGYHRERACEPVHAGEEGEFLLAERASSENTRRYIMFGHVHIDQSHSRLYHDCSIVIPFTDCNHSCYQYLLIVDSTSMICTTIFIRKNLAKEIMAIRDSTVIVP